MAAKRDHAEMVAELLEGGADINARAEVRACGCMAQTGQSRALWLPPLHGGGPKQRPSALQCLTCLCACHAPARADRMASLR